MTNKEAKYPSSKSRKYSTIKYGVEEHGRTNINRRVPFSYKDTDMITTEQSRARLINQIIGSTDKNLSNEFASYYYQSNSYSDPFCLLTSHTVAPRLKSLGKSTALSPIPAYPSTVQSLRWSPYVEVSTPDESQIEATDDRPKIICRCENCTMKTCPSKVYSSKRSSKFKDNIMTFSDQYTMTPKLNDACCGVCTPLTSPKVSNVAITTSNIAVRDTQTRAEIQQVYAPPKSAIPILKNCEYLDPVNKDYKHCHGTYFDDAERDTYVRNDYNECDQSNPTKITYEREPIIDHPYCEHCHNPRKVLYNEGISDSIANHYPIEPVRVPSPTNVVKDYRRVSVMSKYCIDSEDKIPFSHRNDSKYHYSCKTPNSNKHFCCDSDTEEVKRLTANPKTVRKTYTSQVKRIRTPSIILPKKVLTSERDIESYIDKSAQHTSPIPAVYIHKK
ncbi:uncharacterized protein LOC116412657 [Galleria mellonella]|uniref:Uncharacterized protein LOC116412657 n=1 Tax=Galleria mellonella TaxID=7137 RepID=A0A6J3BT66_GALME|nr:uncharacterized protein LOC116412657 [Galleria mellonella]